MGNVKRAGGTPYPSHEHAYYCVPLWDHGPTVGECVHAYPRAFVQFVLATRRMFKTQVTTLVVLCGAARSAEYLNEFLGMRWRGFATQNYFDPRGIFISLMFSAPIVLIVLTLVVRAWLDPLSQLLSASFLWPAS